MDLGAGYLIVTSLGRRRARSRRRVPEREGLRHRRDLSLGFRVTSMIGIRVGGDFRQFGLSLHWTTGQPGIMAGGATDRYITAWGGLEIVLDGVGGGGGEEAKRRRQEAGPEGQEGRAGRRRARRRRDD